MIENDFFGALDNAALGYDIAWPGGDFSPPDSGYWLEPVVIRGDGIDIGLPYDSTFSPNGALRIGVCCRPGNGVIGLSLVAATVIAALPKGTRFSDGTFISNSPRAQSVIAETDRLIMPVTMNYST